MAPVKKPPRERTPHFIKQWRLKRELNQTDVQDKLGWSQSKVSRIENLEGPYDQDAVEQLAELLKVDVVDLLKSDPANPDDLWRLLVQVSKAPANIREQATTYLRFLLQSGG